ncbi:response regulator [Rhodovulum steppense]|uniref:LuxR family two component transcriptional regulator n=1 Tax=Rhodovulum steppense TaxID=540251 RepID=A0A4R1YWU2_9RHOB|nr:response regulator transcription factor [Rhodovulum steppense]TCM85457.1 LuxR family two component transcriptional regulator [Rhodovulum steppense]
MRLLIADDHELLRDTLRLFLAREEAIEVEFESDLPSALRAIETRGPFDLVLLDYSMPGMNGLEGLKSTLDAGNDVKVAIISGVASPDVADRVLALGASGFLPKALPAKTLANAVRFMAAGEIYVPVQFLRRAKDETTSLPASSQLLPREVEVLRGLCAGKTNKEIARDMNVQEPTVKLYVKTLFRKIGVRNRTQAALYAKEFGFS